MQVTRDLAIGYWLATSALMGLCACGGGSEPAQSPDPQLSFPTPTAAELQAVTTEWNQRDLGARDVELANQDTLAVDYDVQIYRHRVGANTHYGAVTIPKNALPGTVPVVVHADGLDQQNPPLNLDENLQMAGALLQGVVYVVPTFRGRSLIYKGVSYPADGDFCDAYDGAADDAIALLNVVASEVPAANLDRVMARGGSRGGNTALLMAVRDARIKLVLAIAAPVDFNRLEVRTRYAGQFRCQFLDNKTPEASRLRVLASSPLHFPVLPSVRKIFLFHGSADEVVPVWNASEMAARLQARGVPTELKIFEGYGHQDLGSAPDFRAAQRAAFGELFTME
jgi:dipeptidyl aminopeptidase/acylaminoacyl peptidase